MTHISHFGFYAYPKAHTEPYGYPHVTDFLDVWLPNETVGIDHVISMEGDVELRIAGMTIEELP